MSVLIIPLCCDSSEVKMNFCSNCGVKKNKESNYCSSCGESLSGIVKPIVPISGEPLESEVKLTGYEENRSTSIIQEVSIDSGRTLEFKLESNTVLKLDEEKVCIEYLDSFLGKIYTFINGAFKPIYYKDINNITCKHGGAVKIGRFEIELSSGKKIKLIYAITTFGAIKERNATADKVVEFFTLRRAALLSNFTGIASASDSLVGTDKINTKGAVWYKTKWVWFWIICVFPIGIYGLIKRADPEDQKKWWCGVAALFLMSLILDDSKGTSNTTTAKASTGKIYIKKGALFCGTESQFDEQTKWLAQGVMEFAPGCLSSGVKIEGVIIDSSYGIRAIRSIRNGKVYWVGTESIFRE